MTETPNVRNESARSESVSSRLECLLGTYLKLSNSDEGAKFQTRQVKERATVDDRYAHERKTISSQVRGCLDIERWIEAIRGTLYDSLGIDRNTWNNSPAKQYTKGIVDSLVLENIELAKTLSENGFRPIIASIEYLLSEAGIRTLILKVEKISIDDIFSQDAYSPGRTIGSIGFGVFGMTKGIVRSEIKHLAEHEDSRVAKEIGALASEQPTAPPKISELVFGFDPIKTSPKEALATIERLNSHLDIGELLNTTNGIGNFAQSLENMTRYIVSHIEQIGSKGEYIRAIIESKQSLKTIISDPRIPQKDILLLRDIVNTDLLNAIYTLNPQIWPKK